MSTPFTILFVDDLANDRFLLGKAFAKTGLPAMAKFVEDGQMLKDYMLGVGRFSNRQQFPLPQIVVTDFRMPGYDGMQVLEWLKRSEEFRNIPVFILSAYMLEREFLRSRELGAEAYLTKPMAFQQMIDLLKTAFEPYIKRAAVATGSEK